MNKNKIHLYSTIIISYLSVLFSSLTYINGDFIYPSTALSTISFISAIILVTTIFKNKYTLGLKIMHVITIFLLYPFEMAWFGLIRIKYNKITPGLIKQLSNEGLKFHIVFGTFLFYIRNNNFKDDDMDIAVYHQDYKDPKEVIKILNKIGFWLNESWVWKGQVAEYSFTNDKNIQLDIYFFDKNDPRQRTWDEKNNRYARKEIKYAYKLKEYTYKDIKFMGPSEPKKYLEWEYGLWEQPDPTYHWFLGGQGSNKAEHKGLDGLVYKKHKK